MEDSQNSVFPIAQRKYPAMPQANNMRTREPRTIFFTVDMPLLWMNSLMRDNLARKQCGVKYWTEAAEAV
jgi:hypothetical protein